MTAISELTGLFEDWLDSHPARGLRAGDGELSEASAQLYRDMWSVFAAHCARKTPRTRASARLHPLQAITQDDLHALLTPAAAKAIPGTSGWSERYAWRMLHLIDRVLAFHAQREGSPKNNAAHALLQQPPYRHANASHLDAAPELLSDGDVERLIRFLSALSGTDHQAHASVATSQPTKTPWKAARDAAVVGVMLGAGLAPGDVQALLMDGLAIHDGPQAGVPWRLTVPADGLSPQHQTPLASWAGHLLARWLLVRQQLGMAGAHVFTSTLKGSALSRMSCHRIAVNLLDAAGITGGVPFRLRHTFAVRQLALGHSEETVGRWLGLVESKAMRRYVVLAEPATGAQ